MIRPERRREDRVSCTFRAGVFLGRDMNDPHASGVYWGRLTSFSRFGAGIALDAVMADRVHLAYGPMESDALNLNLVLQLDDRHPPLVLPVRPVWFNKEYDPGIPPFRIGVEFRQPLSPRQVKKITSHSA